MNRVIKVFMLVGVVALIVSSCGREEGPQNKETISSNISINDLTRDLKEISNGYAGGWDLNTTETDEGISYETNEFFSSIISGSADKNGMIKTIKLTQNNGYKEYKLGDNLTEEEMIEGSNYLSVRLVRLSIAGLVYENMTDGIPVDVDKEPESGEPSVRRGWERTVEEKGDMLYVNYRYIGEQE